MTLWRMMVAPRSLTASQFSVTSNRKSKPLLFFSISLIKTLRVGTEVGAYDTPLRVRYWTLHVSDTRATHVVHGTAEYQAWIPFHCTNGKSVTPRWGVIGIEIQNHGLSPAL